MHHVEVEVLLLSRNGTMGLSRWLRLPFVPFVGMDLLVLTAQPDQVETVASVAWDVQRNCFFVELMDRQDTEHSLCQLIDAYGPLWKLHEPGTDPVEEDL